MEIMSAGGVVYRETRDGGEIVVCGRFNTESYHLPKGTPEPGETREETALREVREETGLNVEILRFVGEINYLIQCLGSGEKLKKTVFFHLMKSTGGDFSLHDEEFDFAKWVKVSEIVNTLTYINEVHIVQKSLSLVKSGSGRAPQC